MKELTKKQELILTYIEEYRNQYSLSPSFKDIQSRFGFRSPNAVTKHLTALEKKGYIRFHRESYNATARSIIPKDRKTNNVPLVGRIVAGIPVEASENIEESLNLSALGIDNYSNNYFALKVVGESMVNAHIVEGDTVVIKKQSTVSTSEIAVVLWNGEATLKFVRKNKNSISLIPANDKMNPIIILPEKTDSFLILGKVVTVIRHY